MKRHFLLVITLALIASAQAVTINHIPYYMSFDNQADRVGWHFITSSNANANTWVIARNAEYAYYGDYMLFMSQDGGATRTYTTVPNQDVVCMAYCQLESLPAGQYTLDFHYMGPKDTRSSFRMAVLTSEPNINTYYWYDPWTAEKQASLWWQDAKYTFTADGLSTYYLCFRFNANRSELETCPGWAVDAIQIYPSDLSPSCAQVPQELSMTRNGNRAILSWAGNASEYQVEYYMSDTSANISYRRDNVTSTEYSFNSASVVEGTYHFRVRAICSEDTSAWEALDYQLVYDIGQHCFDYLNFSDPNVKPQQGYFSCPWCWGDNAVDYGFNDSRSRHTVHHYPHDWDERTNYKLRTYPKGQPAAVRLGNWETGGYAEDIVYTMHVNEDMGVLKLRYALVMQLPGHNPDQQPRFTLEFLDTNGELIDSCGYVDFTASADLTGWNTEHVPGEADVIWKDWTLVGLNMRDYKGRDIQIRITTKDCSEGAHYGYAYFTLSCSRGVIEGTHCGMKPDSFVVDEGFYYRWYRKYDEPRIVLNTDREQRVYYLTDPKDTATYCVDMINKVDTNCYYTLEASSLIFMTHAVAGAVYEPSNCTNYVQFTNDSKTEGFYWDDGRKMVIQSTDIVEEHEWDFGQGRTSTEWAPRIAVGKGGETMHVVLRTYMESRSCVDTCAFDFVVPAIGDKSSAETHYFCKDEVFIFKGQTYDHEGEFPVEQLKAWTGCDSTHMLVLRYFHTDTIKSSATLCESDSSMEWRGRTLTEAGLYYDTIRSRTCGCDSIIYVLDLEVQPILDVQVTYEPQSFCSGSGTVEVPFTILSGSTTSYDLLFSDTAKMLGFKDRLNQPIQATDNKLVIDINESVWAGPYEATLIFHNRHCDTLHFAIPFTVYYNPDSLITQRWNDFLSVRKTAYDYYGGFTDYQWYKNGQRLDGQTGTQLYLPDVGLDGGAYAIELTRTKDGIRMRSCDFYPAEEPSTVTIIVYPTVLSARQKAPVHVRTGATGRVLAYNQAGTLVGQWTMTDGDNQVMLPAAEGLYLLRLLFDSGRIETRKIIVQ